LLCYAMCFTVGLHIISIHFDQHSSDLGGDTCLAPKGLRDRGLEGVYNFTCEGVSK